MDRRIGTLGMVILGLLNPFPHPGSHAQERSKESRPSEFTRLDQDENSGEAQAIRVSQTFGPARARPLALTQQLQIGGAVIQIDLAQGSLDLPASIILQWVQDAAKAVTTYYGRFPVSRARILILPAAEEHGVLQGTTWGNMGGFPGFTRIRLGQHTTQDELTSDWTMTHELVHMAFPDLPDDQHWMEEGLATYIEPIARAQSGEIPVTQVWTETVQGMPKGEPGKGDLGLDRTHTWGRTYWGGAMFCLVADVAIRRQTHNRAGLQQALRAIVGAGGTIDKQWPLSRTLEIGDQATGTTVLISMYKQWSASPSPVDLQILWSQLGVRLNGNSVEFDSKAPLAKIREGITAPKQ